MNPTGFADQVASVSLPPGWARFRVGDIVSIIRGIGFPATAKQAGPGPGIVGCLRTTNVQASVEWDDLWHVPEQYVRSPAQIVAKDDILISLANSLNLVGKVALVGEVPAQSTLGAFISALRVHRPIDPRYVYYQLTAQQSQHAIREMASTTTNISNVSTTKLAELSLLIAPLAEQQRIADRIDELFTDLAAGVAALERVKRNLTRYRAAVLHAAVTGRLTEVWRKQHGPLEEPGPKLLERILAERRRLWEERTRAKYEKAGKQPPKNWRERYPEPFSPGTLAHGAALPSLPDTWCWATHDQVGDVQLGRQRAPEHHTGSHMRPYLRVANVYEDRIDTSDVLQMNFTPEEFKTYELRHGDILLNEGQSMELVGRPAMYRGELPGGCFQNTLVRQRAIAPLVPEYALIVCLAQFRAGRFRKIASITTSIAHLGAQRFAALEFPLPPVAEQEAIIDTVKEKLSLIDALTLEVQRGLVRASRLRQAILKAAFEGKLVPQDPADEPASVLLERIRADAAAQVSKPKPTSRPKKTRKAAAR